MDIAIVKTMIVLVLYIVVGFSILIAIRCIVKKFNKIEIIEEPSNENQRKSYEKWTNKYKNSLTTKSIERIFELEGKDMFVTWNFADEVTWNGHLKIFF